MKRMNRLGLVALSAGFAALAASGAALAQSGATTPNAFLPTGDGWTIDPNPNWSTIILGPASAGFKGKADWHFKNPGGSLNYYGPAPGSKITTDLNGFVFGVQAGYQHQFGPILIGAFTTLQGGDIQEVVNCADAGTSTPGKCRAELNKVYTVQGRLGLAQGPWLFYINGGYAHADINASFEMLGSRSFSGQYGTNAKIGHDGWVAGLGFAFKFRNGITLGFEYNHIRVEANEREFRLSCSGGSDSFAPGSICGNNVRFKPDPDVAGLRLNVPLGEQQTAAQAPVAQAQVPPPAPAPQAAPQPAVQRPAAPRPPAQPATQRPASQPAPAPAPKAPPAPAKKVDPPVVGPDGKKGEGK